MFDKLKYLIAMAGGVVVAHIKAHLPLIGIVFFAVLLDILTGAFAAVYTGKGLSSKKAHRGVIKKAVLFLSLGFGIFLDFLVPMAAAQIGVELDSGVMFSSVVAFYIAFCECVSVCENIYRCNPSAFPKWIADLLAESADKLDRGDGK